LGNPPHKKVYLSDHFNRFIDFDTVYKGPLCDIISYLFSGQRGFVYYLQWSILLGKKNL